jgi:tRNA (guanine-N7-)-methyltransferase
MEGMIDPANQFEVRQKPGNQEYWLEVGFGGGEHLAAQAEANPEVGIFGCEPFENGVASLLSHIENKGLRNVSIHDDDARDLIAVLPGASISKAFLLFPDPWPKSRHVKRRFVSLENLTSLARVLKDGAEFRVATDHVSYCRWALSQLLKHPDFDWHAECAADWKVRSPDWPATRYEQKAFDQGRKPVYFRFTRKMRGSI